eukprot:4319193-Pleurochrysis_carterae.AAC.1
MTDQQRKYAKSAGSMQNMYIREQWAAFVDANAWLFEDKKAVWRTTLRHVKHFIEEGRGEERPSFSRGDVYERRLATWLWHQESNYAKKAFIMQD